MGVKKLKNLKINKFLDHMEFLGYEIIDEEKREEYIRAIHTNKPTMLIQLYEDVLVVHSLLPVREELLDNKIKVQKFVHELNDHGNFVFAGLTEDNNVFFFAYYFGLYGKKEFGRFIDMFNEDYFSKVHSVDDWKKYLEAEE